jgi:DNA-binding transcriptional ArsR family regulator
MVLCVKPANAHHLFRALADPTRRAIFEELTRHGEQTVHALTRYAGVSQPAVSKHLTVLKRAKLVRHRGKRRETHYRAEPRCAGADGGLAPSLRYVLGRRRLVPASICLDTYMLCGVYQKGWNLHSKSLRSRTAARY